MAKEFSYEIKKDLGTISENGDYSTHLTLTSWNNREPKYDLRSWKLFDDDENRTCGKGITFTADELDVLRETLVNMEGK